MGFGTKVEQLVTSRQNTMLIDALRCIKTMVDTSKGSESLTCLALQDYVAAVLRDAGAGPANEGQNGRNRR